ncbi:hypothetical protein LTR78_003418 [Recurvomyces mirabilis]|uniref:BED-type domain-containing protein n=1 Tax=Recurvomyces mirabilis TaxID=574656 RepID=A0AAE0WRF9_9PEZI|nr:hypothetical protein LTR78_003418 [Recurvomyces mirabilis]KAK5154548.1 hypothetical protein LTS14_006685 [Recurvomyces mirabilis]
MGKAKRKHEDIQEVLDRPWCYYCERDFNDLVILMSHQKSKHFKCYVCNRRLNTIGGLSVHMSQVHKEKIDTVENALDNRKDINVEIFGMEGIPEEIMYAHKQRLTEAYFRKEAERRAATGNPPPGGGGQVAKRQKVEETPEQLKARLAEHKAKRAAEKLGLTATGSGGSTPQQPVVTPGNVDFDAPMPPYTANGTSPPPSYGYGQPAPMQGIATYPAASPNGLPSAYQSWPVGSPAQPFPTPYPPPQSPYGFQPQSTYAPDPYQQQSASPWVPPPGPPALGPAMNMVLPPQPTGLSHPSNSYQQQSATPFTHQTTNTALPPPPTGLPQRPSFNPPNLSKEDMAKMHTGQNMPPGVPHAPQPVRQSPSGYGPPHTNNFATSGSGMSELDRERLNDGIQDMIDEATKQGTYASQPVIKQEPDIEHEPGMAQEPRIKQEPGIEQHPNDGREYSIGPTNHAFGSAHPDPSTSSSIGGAFEYARRPSNGDVALISSSPIPTGPAAVRAWHSNPSAPRRGSRGSNPSSRRGSWSSNPTSRRNSHTYVPGAPTAPAAIRRNSNPSVPSSPAAKPASSSAIPPAPEAVIPPTEPPSASEAATSTTTSRPSKKSSAKKEAKSTLDPRLTYSDPILGTEELLYDDLPKFNFDRLENDSLEAQMMAAAHARANGATVGDSAA